MQRFSESWGHSGLRAIVLAGLIVTTPALAQLSEEADNPPEVSGPVEAVERDRQSIIVDGRRFQLASTVDFDGSDVAASRALRRLSEGDQVQLLDVESSYDEVTRIRTRLQ